MCGAGLKPFDGVDDPTSKRLGVVLLGAERPVVLCGSGMDRHRNEAFSKWRQALAEPEPTPRGGGPEHVSLH